LELYILRHGEAGKSLGASVRDDKRSLTEQGRKDVQGAGEAIVELGIRFDHILSSPLNRAAQTAELVARTTRSKTRVEFWDELKPEGDQRALCSKLSLLGRESTVLVVGHEPYLTTLLRAIVGGNGARIVLKKSGLARVSVKKFGPEMSGELRWLLSPRVLNRIS